MYPTELPGENWRSGNGGQRWSSESPGKVEILRLREEASSHLRTITRVTMLASLLIRCIITPSFIPTIEPHASI